jgi:hypothetical protein
VGISERDIERPSGEAGEYEVNWKAVGYVQGGTFALDHEIRMNDFRREFEVARDRFTIAPGDEPIPRDQPCFTGAYRTGPTRRLGRSVLGRQFHLLALTKS